ncbi:olfactomedin-4-like [Xyrauchen texanus]|uniref:olfactomedin-4-like n=1 Tax=Xyrauchen texanus TaxID=154827 RepID=UPI002241D09C|nr:olfactomedin-4-like [Xyrauchen texanus]
MLRNIAPDCDRPSTAISIPLQSTGLSAPTPWTESNTTVDSNGKCICEAFLPNSTFPIREPISLENTTVGINHQLQIEFSKVWRNLKNSSGDLQVYIAKILIELIEGDPDSYIQLHMEEVKIKIREVEALVVELQMSIQTSSAVLVTIHHQVTLETPFLIMFVEFSRL